LKKVTTLPFLEGSSFRKGEVLVKKNLIENKGEPVFGTTCAPAVTGSEHLITRKKVYT